MGEEGAGSGGRGVGSGVEGREEGDRGREVCNDMGKKLLLFDKKLIENCLKRYHQSSIRHIGHIMGPTMHTIRF